MNIVIVVIDTLRYDYVGANGPSPHGAIRTPNLDRLAAESWSFDRAFAASFPTIPHRMDVITGRYGAPFHPWNPLAPDVPTIPRALADKGYCTQLVHDTPHLVNGGHAFDYPFHAWRFVRGAEVDRPWIADSWEFPANWALDPLFDAYPGDMASLRRAWAGIGSYVQANRGRERDEDWNVARLFLAASDSLKDNRSRDKFFLWVDCFDPHEPWDSPPEFVKMYDETPGYDGRIDPRSLMGKVRNDPALAEAAVARVKAGYAAKVSFMDRWLGRFLDTLEATGLARNTAVLLTADHGTNVGDRRRPGGGGGHLFGKCAPPRENESHVPFMVRVPGGGSGRSDAIVQPQDVFATIAAIAGASVPDGIESHDVLRMAREGAASPAGEAGPRTLALAGGSAGDRWSKGRVLFSAFDREWRLGFAADPGKCELERLGDGVDVAAEHADAVARLHAAAIDEIERRGLDPALVKWLRSGGRAEFPDDFRPTDARPRPPTWTQYWGNHYAGE